MQSDTIKELNCLSENGSNLSIIVQGPLLKNNLQKDALMCQHWRQMFPQAEIIFSISSCNFIDMKNKKDDFIQKSFLYDDIKHDTIQLNSLETLFENSNIIVGSFEGIPLPPIKNDTTSANNINLQISAAQKGLAYTSKKYVLRIRNDLCLTNKSFIDIYNNSAFKKRGNYSKFTQRVMIPEVFTINPLTLFRMPFHYSDWFHFGLTEDVKRIWDEVIPMRFPDSIYYENHNHIDYSNVLEKRFIVKIACEQYIHFPYFKKSFPEIQLNYHNDTRYAKESLFIMADNFVIANLRDINSYISKYQHIVRKMSKHTRVECMSQEILDRIINDPYFNIDGLIREQKKKSDHRMFWGYDYRTALFRRLRKACNRFFRWYRES